MKDIAKETGFSINTVSLALRDMSEVNEETKKKIQKVADEMGYVRNVGAAQLRSSSNWTIGVIVSNLNNYFFAEILKGISDAMMERDQTIIVLSTDEILKKEEEALKVLSLHRVAGAIIIPAIDIENTIDYSRFSFPIITLDRKKRDTDIPYHIFDSYKSGKLVGEFMLSEGRRNPAYIGINLKTSCDALRLGGFRDSLKEGGITLSLRREGHCTFSQNAAKECVKKMLEKDKSIDSIFVHCDVLAFGVIRGLYEMGIRIPEDIRVIGHDDVSEAANFIPALSTVRVPIYKMGMECAESLLDLIDERVKIIKNVIYDPQLIIRES